MAIFLSTPSARRATNLDSVISQLFRFLSTPSARRATPRVKPPGDFSTDFYPRPPRGGRPAQLKKRQTVREFLSTPSARRATQHAGLSGLHPDNFYPRPPRGGRRLILSVLPISNKISIHALREEGDYAKGRKKRAPAGFLSTPSARRATDLSLRTVATLDNFYPRPPRGGRPDVPCFGGTDAHFYPRPPRGGRRAQSAARAST